MSHEASSKFHRKSFQTDRFVRGFFQISQQKLAKASLAVVRGWWSAIVLSFAVDRGWWSAIVLSFAVVQLHQTPFTPDTFLHQITFTPDAFYTKHLLHQAPFAPNSFQTRNLLHQPPFTTGACYTKHLLHQTPVTPDTLYTGHLLHQAPFTPGTLYTRKLLHQTLFTPNTSYTKHLLHQAPFTPNTFYTEKLPKGSFCAMLPTIFTEKASKTIVSCEASSKFHSTSLQNERFARCFRQFSQKKLPKRSFRARLPRNFTEQASKKIVSCEASSKFHRTSFQKDRFVRGFLEISQNKLPKRSFRARPPRNFTEQASKKVVSCEASSKFHRTILLKRTFRTRLPTISTENLRFATVSCNRPTESYERVHPAKAKCASRYNGVPSKISKCVSLQWRAQKCMNPAHDVRGNPRHTKITILPQFRTSDQHEVTRGLRRRSQNLRFTTVLDVRWARNDERVARLQRPIRISPQFWTSDEHEVTRGLRRRSTKFAFHHSFGRPTSTKWREGCEGHVQNLHFTTVLDVRRARSDELGWSPVLVNQTHPA